MDPNLIIRILVIINSVSLIIIQGFNLDYSLFLIPVCLGSIIGGIYLITCRLN